MLEDVPQETLFSTLTVNRDFSKAALPLLYRHLYFQPKRTSKRGKISPEHLRHVKMLDIFDHDLKHCEKLEFSHSPDVVRFHWNDSIEELHKWHGDDQPCPLLSLKPKSVVFVDFDATKAPPDAKAFKNVIYPHTENRIVMWDISEELDNKGWNAAVKNVIFPPRRMIPASSLVSRRSRRVRAASHAPTT